MAISYLCGFQSGSGADVLAVNGANCNINTTRPRTGSYSLQINPVAGGSNYVDVDSRAAGGTRRSLFQSVRFYLQLETLPSADVIICFGGLSAGSILQLLLKTDGTLSLQLSGVVRATSTLQISADATGVTWHRIDFDCGWSGGAGMRVFVDGVLFVSDTTDTGITPRNLGTIGMQVAAGTVTTTMYIDDVAWYDSALPATLGDYKIGLLLPSSDNAVGGWKRPDGSTATGLSTEVDNIPPTGNTSTTNTTGGHDKNTVSSTTDNLDVNCAAYNTLLGAGDTVLAVQAICNNAQAVTTGSPKAGAIVIASNPTGQTENSLDFGIPNGSLGFVTAAAMGTFQTGWGSHVGPVTETPSVTLTSGPVVRVGKRVATTREVDVDFMGVYVMYATAAASDVPQPAARRRHLRSLIATR